MAKLDLQQADFLFHNDSLADAGLRVSRFRGRESLSQPFEFLIELTCSDKELDLEAPIGEPASLTLIGRRYDGSRYERQVHGVIERFLHLGSGERQSHYAALLVPSIKPLFFTRTSRIFQNLSVQDVTQQVLQGGKIAAHRINPFLHGTYTERDYCVQYQESDLNFVQRLWEEEGIFYFFEHGKGSDVLTLGDGSHAYVQLADYATVVQRDHSHLYEEGITVFRSENALRSGTALMRDFRFKHPSLDLEARAEVDKFADYQMYHYPGQYVDLKVGQRLTKVRLEEEQCQRHRYFGTGNVREMLPGYTFTLAGSRRASCNQEYLIVSVEHEGTQPQALGEEAGSSAELSYQNRIECIPSNVAFRPPRITRSPSIPGIQTAVVVGPAGEEIHCDEHGRVKVQFPWDRQGKKDDGSSCWIRSSQPWGGGAFGGVFLPRVGQEVLIQFIEGDPDRPVIIGRVYNGENPLPYRLPDHKTVSSLKTASSPGGGGYNELRFEDAAGSEEIYLQGQLDMNTLIKRDRTQRFGRDTVDRIGRDRTRRVARNEKVNIGADRSARVGGSETLSVGGNHSVTVAGNQAVNVTGGQASLKVNSVYKVDATSAIQVQAPATIKLTCGESSIEMTPSQVQITVGGSCITITPDGITGETGGVHAIKGGQVKINC